jgi:hypothetical protein
VVAGAADARLAGAAVETEKRQRRMKGPERERVPPRLRATLERYARGAAVPNRQKAAAKKVTGDDTIIAGRC